MLLKYPCAVFIPVLLLLLARASAQFNDSTHYYFNVGSTGSINKTNSDQSFLLSQGLKFGVRKKTYSINSSSAYVYGEQNDEPTNNDFNSSVDMDFFHHQSKLFYWGLINFTSSYSLKITRQFQSGAGIAYRFSDTTNLIFTLSDGILYETGDLFIDTLHDVYNTFRNSFRVVLKWTIQNRLVLSTTSFLQNSLTESSDYIVRTNTALSFRLYKWLNLTAAFVYNRFNRTHRENLLFTYGLTIDKYF